MIAGAVRRAVRAGESVAVPRPVDLWAVLESAIAEIYRRRLGGENFQPLIQKFNEGLNVETSDLLGAENFLAQLGRVPGLSRIMQRLDVADESRENAASALEFALEGLHLMKRINKEATGPGAWSFGG